MQQLQHIEIKIIDQRLGKLWPLPKYHSRAAAGIDIRACIETPVIVKANESLLIPSGIAISINDPNHVGILAPRSGMGHKHGIVLGNLIGIIDADYQGEIKVSCWNRGQSDYEIKPGDRIAQLLLMPVNQPEMQFVDKFSHESQRGDGGFGSTGKQ